MQLHNLTLNKMSYLLKHYHARFQYHWNRPGSYIIYNQPHVDTQIKTNKTTTCRSIARGTKSIMSDTLCKHLNFVLVFIQLNQMFRYFYHWQVPWVWYNIYLYINISFIIKLKIYIDTSAKSNVYKISLFWSHN